MPENTANPPNNPKKARLGRGLGSLLGNTPELGAEPDTKPAKKLDSHLDTQVDSQKAKNQKLDIQPTSPLKTQDSSKTEKMDSQLSSQDLDTQLPEKQAVAIQPVPLKTINEEAQIWTIPIDRLVPNTQQPRQTFTPDALKELSASIKQQGILQPITARRLGEREFEIIAGERRWRAAQLAGLHEVPVILKTVSEQVSLELAIIENIQREDLNPLEEAEALDHLMTTYNMTQQQVAEKLGKERSSIANFIRLLALPTEVKEMLRSNELSAGHAKVILGAEKPETQIFIAKAVLAEKLSVRATEKLVAKSKSEDRKLDQSPTPAAPEVSRRLIDSLSSELQKLFGTKIGIDYAAGKGRVSVHFYSDDQLTQIVEKLRRSWQK